MVCEVRDMCNTHSGIGDSCVLNGVVDRYSMDRRQIENLIVKGISHIEGLVTDICTSWNWWGGR